MSKILNFTTLAILLCVSSAFPADSLSRWFSASYADLQVTMRRYAYCVSSLAPKREPNSLNETDYLINKMKAFLEEANLENDQLLNVTTLMDNLCRPEPNADYPISVHIDVNLYNGSTGKRNRCRAIDEAMDSMFYVFKKASMNSSEPLDFSVIQFYPNATNNEASYNLTDLINTSWIKSETHVDHICKITDALKEFVQVKTNQFNSTRRTNLQKSPESYYDSYWSFIDYLLEPLLGYQRRLYLESNNRMEMVYNLVANQLAYVRHEMGKGISATTRRFTDIFSFSNMTNIAKTNESMVSLNSSIRFPVVDSNLTAVADQQVLSTNLTSALSPPANSL